MNGLGMLSSSSGVRLHHYPPPPPGMHPTSSSSVNLNRLFSNSAAANLARRSPTPECPNIEHMDRKRKKPLMEKKRRARINVCYDRLKEMLLHSELQQNSKLEKADIMEKTVLFVTLLQQQNARVHHQLQQLLQCSEPGLAFLTGIREGVSLSVIATVDLLAGLPAPFCSPELCLRVRREIPEKVAQAAQLSLSSGPPPADPRHSPASNCAIATKKQQQTKTNTPRGGVPSPWHVVPPAAPPSGPTTTPPPIIHHHAPPMPLISWWPFLAGNAATQWASSEPPKKKAKMVMEEEKGGQEHEEDHRTGDTVDEEVLVDVESVEGMNESPLDGGGRTELMEQDSGVFSEKSDSSAKKGVKRSATGGDDEEETTTGKKGRKRRKSMWTVTSVLEGK